MIFQCSFTTTNWTAESQNFGTVVRMKCSPRTYAWIFCLKTKQPFSKEVSHSQRNGIKRNEREVLSTQAVSQWFPPWWADVLQKDLSVLPTHTAMAGSGLSPPQAHSLCQHLGTDPLGGGERPRDSSGEDHRWQK